MEEIQTLLTYYGLQIIAAIIIIVIGRIVAKFLAGLLRKAMQRANVDETLINFAASAAFWALMTFVLLAALGRLGIQTGSFIAVIGAAGLAVGFALQGSLSNFAAGIMLLIFRPFKVTDFIEAGGALGVVQEIGIFTTTLNSPDNKRVIIPNGKLTGDNIINYTANDTRRVDMVAGVSYSDDLDKARTIIENVLAADERILADPAPTVAVSEMADSSVNFVVRPWVRPADYWNVYFAVHENIKKQFDAEGISIPFPQQDVHLHQD